VRSFIALELLSSCAEISFDDTESVTFLPFVPRETELYYTGSSCCSGEFNFCRDFTNGVFFAGR
jgi:hypothetical protein